MWSQPPCFSMFRPHLGHGFAPIFLIASTDFLSSRFLALSQEPLCHGRTQDKQCS